VPLSKGEGSDMLQGTKEGGELMMVLQGTKEGRELSKPIRIAADIDFLSIFLLYRMTR
jgi:hypothetical protein